MSKLLVAQEDFYDQTLKEFIAIQTLIAENRVNDLSDFLDKYSYIAVNETTFTKFDVEGKIPNNLYFTFVVGDDKNITGIITKKISDNQLKLKMTKSELHSLWANLLSNIELGMPYNMFKFIKDSYINKDGDGLEESEYEIINRYKIKIKANKEADWQTFSASNFNTQTNPNEKYWVYTFMGPGKLDWIDIYFNKFQDLDANDEVGGISFYFRVVKNQDSYEKEEPINIPFFMAVKNFNDRIWDDK
jgi:hypothetical protein